ncbi:hypothetical protein TIFTF001_013297 [Ficus carica]|uniref:NIM1-interacting protein n=1 Tax=Ficus carica TaxID=3494 RepID=A0AA88D4G9_FICCA|nr:hypothetical protein TIFTF001_013297 [Ficus carica]
MKEEKEDHQQRKKRKLDEPDEEKVEEFFALIRSTREARDRLRNNNCSSGSGLNKKKDYNFENFSNGDGSGDRIIAAKEIGVWNPTFRPEDFLNDHEKKIGTTLPLTNSVLVSASQLLVPEVVGASKMEEEEEEKEKNEKLEDNKGGTDRNNIDNNRNDIDLELSL